VAGFVLNHWLGFMDGLRPASSGGSAWALVLPVVMIGLFAYLHFRIRKFSAGRVLKQIEKQFTPGIECDRLRQAFVFNTRPWHSIFLKTPVGWGNRSRKRLHRVIAEANRYVQTLNDSFTDPSGELSPNESSKPSLSVVPTRDEGKTAVNEPAKSESP